ncbi:MAG: GAF domain-containing protein [Desulfomonile tiedjei]|nr:GAF domain-containing protein [Desulfomonile tiedjei]
MTPQNGDILQSTVKERADEQSPAAIEASHIDPAKMILLFNASKAFASTTDLDQLLNVIVNEVQNVLYCEGAGVLLYDEEKDDFYWRSVQDKGGFFSSAREDIRIPKDQGVCGWVFASGQPALVHDAANDPRIYRQVETKSGFTTRNMICVPLNTRERRLGVLYALNKTDGSFTGEDLEIMQALSSNVALALENASYLESLMNSHRELERLNRVKNKILHHLSHELKTPLAIIEASLRTMVRRMEMESIPRDKLPFERITRNLDRLKTIEKQVGHIVEEKEFPERKVISEFLDHLEDFIEIEAEEEPRLKEALEALRRKIADQFPPKKEDAETVAVKRAFQTVEFRVKQMILDRRLNIEFVPPDAVIVRMQPQIMISVVEGLVRNAIENTPDHGRIVIKGENSSSGYRITVTDCGVGIPESEQPNIFEGFYPVQETDLYSSGRQYAFNAGGTGTDLLKIKIFSERFGFSVRFQSFRCPCIPTGRDVCPGDIAKCACCEKIEDCYEKGGTEFVIEIPPELVEPGDEGQSAASGSVE